MGSIFFVACQVVKLSLCCFFNAWYYRWLVVEIAEEGGYHLWCVVKTVVLYLNVVMFFEV